MSQDVPPGWYPTPDGRQKYWDGSSWTNLPFEGVEPANPVPNEPARSVGRKKLLIGAAIGLVLLLGIGGGVIVWKTTADATTAAELAEAEAKQEAKEQAAVAAQERKVNADRTARTAAVADIEVSIKTMAEKHVADEVIDGPIIDVNCSPLGGGSTDDLTEQTTVFDCFVGNIKNADGTMSGYYYNATMNWTSGQYTYGLGRA